MFNESEKNGYDYQLRFNSSGMINFEIPPTNLNAIDPIKYEDLDKADSYLQSGILTV
jgi:ATP-binding cassette subfamily A (ABC1) protein 3